MGSLWKDLRIFPHRRLPASFGVGQMHAWCDMPCGSPSIAQQAVGQLGTWRAAGLSCPPGGAAGIALAPWGPPFYLLPPPTFFFLLLGWVH